MNIPNRFRKLLRVRLRSWGRTNREIFDDIYENSRWGKNDEDFSISGKGSLPENSSMYEDLIVQYIHDNRLKSILDIGCGDFQVSNRILGRIQEEISYTGVDVSQVVISRNQSLYESDNVKFRQLDVVEDDIPVAELILVREVLQHLPNRDIEIVLSRLLKYHADSHILITNTVARNPRKINSDIPAGPVSRAGMGSGLWLDRPPFNYKVDEVLSVPHVNFETVILTTRLLGPAS